MKPVINVHNPREYVIDIQKSYGAKRELHAEFTDLMMTRGFSYTKSQYIKEKFPKLPKALRQTLVESI